jgi:hypothetical protein
MYPAELCVEVLRSNLRSDVGSVHGWAGVGILDRVEEEEEEEVEKEGKEEKQEEALRLDTFMSESETIPLAPVAGLTASNGNPFAVTTTSTAPSTTTTTNPFNASALKRPSSEITDSRPTKRHEALASAEPTVEQPQPVADRTQSAIQQQQQQQQQLPPTADMDSDDESVHLNMEFDDQDDD